jgi:hypothetical protein
MQQFSLWFTGAIRELNQNVEISETCEVERFFFYRLPNNYKRYVGINSQLDQIIEGGSIDIKRLWFGDYLEQQSTPSEDTAQVDVIFRICQCLSTRWLLECSFFSLEPLD